MGRDLLTSPYGRFYYLPKLLAERGHKVNVLLLSYKREPDVSLYRDGIHWLSVSLFGTGLARYILKAGQLVKKIRPDWVIGFSDTYFGMLAEKLGSRYASNSLVDAYDNYEGYIPWLRPLHYAWRASLSKATVVTAAGPTLADYLGRSRPGKPTLIVPMAADPIGFAPMDRDECRKNHRLPHRKKLIGYFGAVYANRGIGVLFEAFEKLCKQRADVELILSGRVHRKVSLPTRARWLGYVPSDHLPALINSLDVFVVTNRLSAFGNYSHPVKLYEAMRCQVPVVTTETPTTRWILRQHPELLAEPDNPDKLCDKIAMALSLGKVDYGPQPDWETNCEQFERALKEVYG